ncbi:MAG: Flp pilus assembly protein CpaB [Chloroflexi bacterium]|nr:MAG: Flp pilus assembly protein CpaB [Chloroflexota bacterium]
MRLNSIFWWSSSVLLAALAGLLTYGLLNRAAPVVQAVVAETRTVVVATTHIPFRRSISVDEVALREVPVEAAPEGAAISLEQVVGKMATIDLYANQPVLVQHLATPDVVTQQVALSVPRGKIVMVVPTQSQLISNRLLRAGDHIDLLATFDIEVSRQQGSGPLATSIALLQNLEVHAIILPVTAPPESGSSLPVEEGGVFRTLDERAQSILLALDPQDALTIRHLLTVGSVLDLALRAPDDETVLTPEVVDQYYLAHRYKIDLVR